MRRFAAFARATVAGCDVWRGLMTGQRKENVKPTRKFWTSDRTLYLWGACSRRPLIPTYPTAMRSLPLLAALALVLASCSGVEAEDVVLPGRTVLVQRYGTLAPGTFRVRQPSIRLDVEGDDFSLSEIDKTLYLRNRERSFFSLGIGSKAVVAAGQTGEATWAGSYRGDPESSRSCSGKLYVMESTSTLLRGVFAGSCGKTGALLGPHDFTLVEGGFAYRR